MKKIILFSLLFMGLLANAQSDYTTIISGLSTSGNGRAPQGTKTVCRSVWIITAAEMAAAGFTSGIVINGLGFNYKTGQNATTTGNFVAYMQNTADATNLKSTTWATAISTMTTVSNSTITVPAASGTFDVTFSGGTSFTYTGGGLYIAFDYQNLTGTLATTPNVALCNTTLAGGILGAMSTTTTLPTALTASAFRPETRLGVPVSCAKPTNLNAVSTATSSTLSWTNSGSLTELEWGPYNFTQGSGTTVSGVTSPYNLTGLTVDTVYDYYLQTDCGGGNYSAWEGPYSFSTTFDAATPTYNTGFETYNIFPFFGWSTSMAAGSAEWFINTTTAGGPLVQEGINSAVALSNTTAASNSWLLSRGINLTAGTPATITYYVRNYLGTGATGNGSYKFTVGNAQTSAAQTTIISNQTSVSNTTFALNTFTYTPTTTGVYYFGFQNNSPLNAGTQAIILDDFTVTQALATNDFFANQFNVYPNPAKNTVTISNDFSTISSVELTDMNGRIVKSEKLTNVNRADINISNLSQGLYMMKITSDKGTVTKKIVKE